MPGLTDEPAQNSSDDIEVEAVRILTDPDSSPESVVRANALLTIVLLRTIRSLRRDIHKSRFTPTMRSK